MSNENNSDLLHLVFIQPPKHARDAMKYAAEEYGSDYIVNNTYEMVGRAISMCVNHKKLIGELTIVGHGSPDALHIGRDRVTVAALTPGDEFYKANVHLPIIHLTPYFHPSAKIELQQCNCGYGNEGQQLLKKLSQLWRRPVIGFTGPITFGGGVEYDNVGRFTVCVSQFCIVH